jgi:hypothetical protein
VSCEAIAHVALPGIALLAVAALLDPFGITKVRSSGLAASSSPTNDQDGDGIVFRQERILETIPSEPDSDLDGFGDAEELARKTSPINAAVFPTGNDIGMGITARGDRDGLHALVAVYVPDGNYQTLNVKIGVVVGRRLEFLRPSIMQTQTHLNFVPGSASNSQVGLLDLRFPRSWVDASGHLTMFTTASNIGSGTNQAAASMDLFNQDGVIVLAMPDPSYVPPPGLSSAPPQGRDTLFKPLTLAGDDPPAGWSMGEVCAQSAQAVMIGGALVVHEISSAECQGGWEGACPPDCSSSVGTTFTTVDPVVLVGG